MRNFVLDSSNQNNIIDILQKKLRKHKNCKYLQIAKKNIEILRNYSYDMASASGVKFHVCTIIIFLVTTNVAFFFRPFSQYSEN